LFAKQIAMKKSQVVVNQATAGYDKSFALTRRHHFKDIYSKINSPTLSHRGQCGQLPYPSKNGS
jgi:hypothetical protein